MIYWGQLWILVGEKLIGGYSFSGKGKITSHLYDGKHLFYTCCNSSSAMLYCLSLDTLDLLWELDIRNSKRYAAGELSMFEGCISCYGRDRLLLLRPEDGTILREIHIPRVDKLFCPIAVEKDEILLGYTNWSNAGILRYHLSDKKILWKHRRKFEGPQLKCKIYSKGNRALWVKNNTELITLDSSTGQEISNLRTTPWLYTELYFCQGGILYGTAGANGYLNFISDTTEEPLWSAYLKNGCAYFDISKDSVFTGDFDKSVKRFSLPDGRLLDELMLDAEVVGRIAIEDHSLYTVIWGNQNKPIRLIKINI